MSPVEYRHVDCYNDQWHWCLCRNYDGQGADVICVLEDEDGEPLHELAATIIEKTFGGECHEQDG